MINKIYISEFEKENILNQHKRINESTGSLSLGGRVVNDLDVGVSGCSVSLIKDNKYVKTTNSPQDTLVDGSFKFENLDEGTYEIGVDPYNSNYSTPKRADNTVDLKVSIQDFKIKLKSSIKDFDEVTIIPLKVTILDFNFLDESNKKIPNVSYELFESLDGTCIGEFESLDGTSNLTFNGNSKEALLPGKDFTTDNNTISSFYTTLPGSCVGDNSLYIGCKVKGYEVKEQKLKICLNNGAYKVSRTTNGVNTPIDNTIPTRNEKSPNSNIFNIILKKIKTSLTILTKDGQNSVLPGVTVDIYKDKLRKELLKTIVTNQEGLGNHILYDGEISTIDNKGKTPELYFNLKKDGYETMFKSQKVDYNKNNKIDFKLDIIPPPQPTPPPKPPKVFTLSKRACVKLTRRLRMDMHKVDKKGVSFEDLGGRSQIMKRAEEVKDCYVKYKDDYSDRQKRYVKNLVNVQNNLDPFRLLFNREEMNIVYSTGRFESVDDIYIKNNTMGISDTIRNVISEYVDNKKIKIQESRIINNRFKFVIENFNLKYKKGRTTSYRYLVEEKKTLINNGYSRDLVNESFLDIMGTLYGSEGNNVLSDVKLRLGEKIASQVKDKEQEHSMIITAFNEIPEEVIERAIKENRVDELSGLIATKALSSYKTQFGDGGISGLMIASVDENKFKAEVAKLIEPAIKEITTKMDDQFKKVKDVVGGMNNVTT
jgi:hypothetical protein